MAASSSGWKIFDTKAVVIRRSLNIPIIDIDVGFPQLASYEVVLWRTVSNGRLTKVGTIRRGNTGDGIPDEFRIVNRRDHLQHFDKRTISWVIVLQRTASGVSPFTLELEFTQTGGSSPPVVLDHVRESGTMTTNVRGFRGTYHVSVVP